MLLKENVQQEEFMNDFKRMWDFPVKEGVTFQNANRIHPLMQNRVEKLIQRISQDTNVRRLIVYGSSLQFRCSSNSDIDLYIDKYDKDKKLIQLPELDCEVDIITNLSPDSGLYKEIDKTGLVLFER